MGIGLFKRCGTVMPMMTNNVLTTTQYRTWNTNEVNDRLFNIRKDYPKNRTKAQCEVEILDAIKLKMIKYRKMMPACKVLEQVDDCLFQRIGLCASCDELWEKRAGKQGRGEAVELGKSYFIFNSIHSKETMEKVYKAARSISTTNSAPRLAVVEFVLV